MAMQTANVHRNNPLFGLVGVGLKARHAHQIVNGRVAAQWFEIHAENYMVDGGPRLEFLREVRKKFDVSVHGVAASIGGASPPDVSHLKRLRRVIDICEPALVSEHLAWSTHDGVFFNDLLPVRYDQETLRRVSEHVHILQEAVARQVLIENPSAYVQFSGQDYSEPEFLLELVKRTGCGLLLDLNNVYVSAQNIGFGAAEYMDSFPLHAVSQIHVAGHVKDINLERALLIDSHNRPVAPPVWDLLDQTLSVTGPLPVLIEWDDPVPEWSVLEGEVIKAQRVLGRWTQQAKLVCAQ